MGDPVEVGGRPPGLWSFAFLASIAAAAIVVAVTATLWTSYHPASPPGSGDLEPGTTVWIEQEAAEWTPPGLGIGFLCLVGLGVVVYALSHPERISTARRVVVVLLGLASAVGAVWVFASYDLILWDQLALRAEEVGTDRSGIAALFGDNISVVLSNGAEHSVASVRAAALLNLLATTVCVVAPFVSLALVRSSTMKSRLNPAEQKDPASSVSPG